MALGSGLLVQTFDVGQMFSSGMQGGDRLDFRGPPPSGELGIAVQSSFERWRLATVSGPTFTFRDHDVILVLPCR